MDSPPTDSGMSAVAKSQSPENQWGDVIDKAGRYPISRRQ